jgi:hypothetical protein
VCLILTDIGGTDSAQVQWVTPAKVVGEAFLGSRPQSQPQELWSNNTKSKDRLELRGKSMSQRLENMIKACT